VLFAVLLCFGMPGRAALLVDVWIDPDSVAQTIVVDALRASLAETNAEITVELRVHSLDADMDRSAGVSAAGPSGLLVALGSKAAIWLARQPVSAPRLFAFIPESVWRELHTCCLQGQGDASALFIDRPLIQQLRLVKALVPDARRVAVLLGPASTAWRPALEASAEAEGLDLAVGQVGASEPVGPALRGLVDSSDILLALPDPAVFNRDTLYSILLTSYSAGLAVVGYSEAMVRAGAAAAVHLTLEDAGVDLARAILRFGLQRRLGPPGSSPSSSLAVNREVLRSLGIPVDIDSLPAKVTTEGGR
jgi:ABC-type uncharacterized transport system substrate-binding protein